MKRLIKFSIVCFIIVMLSACGKNESPDDDGIQIVEWEPIEAPDSAESGSVDKQEPGESEDDALKSDAGMVDNENVQENKSDSEDAMKNEAADPELTDETGMETSATADPFTGEYDDYDTNEPNLEIQKNADETYQIYIGIFRLASFDDAVGMVTETGLAFTATAPDLSEATGVITLEGDIATVTFDPGWDGFEGVYSYKYYKTSDTPNFNL